MESREICQRGRRDREKKIPSFYFQCDTLGVRVYECLWVFTHVNMHASLRWSSESNCALETARPVGQSDPAMGYLFVEVYKILPHVNVLFFLVGFNWLMKYVFFFAVSLKEGSFIPHTCLHVNVYASFPWSAFSKDFVNLNHYMFSSGDYSQCLYYSNAT